VHCRSLNYDTLIWDKKIATACHLDAAIFAALVLFQGFFQLPRLKKIERFK
jgi:hypothetical protein